MIAYGILPTVAERMEKDPTLFSALSTYLAEIEDENSGRLLLDLLGAHTQNHPETLDQLTVGLETLANSESSPAGLRACGLRDLASQDPARASAIVPQFAASGEGELVEAAAATLADVADELPQERGGGPKLEVESISSYAASMPGEAAELSRVLQLLAKRGDPSLEKVLDSADTANARAHILQSIGTQLNGVQLAKLVAAVAESESTIDHDALIAVLSDDSRIDALYMPGCEEALVYALSLSNTPLEDKHASRLQQIAQGENTELAARAQTMLELASESAEEVLTADAFAEETGVQTRGSVTNVKVEASYRVGYHRADALYRDLNESFYGYGTTSPQNHWHVTLYCGFEPNLSGKKDKLLGIQHFGDPRGIGTIGTKPYQDPRWKKMPKSILVQFSDPRDSIREKMREARKLFKEALFDGFDPTKVKFRGARRTPTMTAAAAEDIVETAKAIDAENSIGYTTGVFTMLNHKGYPRRQWTGKISDIKALRCDGLIEYCYEKNGQRVSTGANGIWNIFATGQPLSRSTQRHAHTTYRYWRSLPAPTGRRRRPWFLL